MSVDCHFAAIKNVQKHPNADALDIATVNGWQVVIPKDSWHNGDLGLFICPDATLPSDKEWCKDLIRYTGSQNRVKIVKLRGEFSHGILIHVEDIKHLLPENYTSKSWQEIATILGIGHFNPPLPNDLSMSGSVLPFGLSKTDEENFQSLSDKELFIGETALATRKLDGCSATYVATPTGEYIICGRRFTYKEECSNRYTIIGQQLKNQLLTYAKNHNKVIAARGEITGQGIQNFKINPDCKGPLQFNLFNCSFPEETDYDLRNGHYGTPNHFLEVNKELGFKTVPILGEVVITKELLKQYENAPASHGEGIVLNCKHGHYKAKSSDYYSKLH